MFQLFSEEKLKATVCLNIQIFPIMCVVVNSMKVFVPSNVPRGSLGGGYKYERSPDGSVQC